MPHRHKSQCWLLTVGGDLKDLKIQKSSTMTGWDNICLFQDLKYKLLYQQYWISKDRASRSTNIGNKCTRTIRLKYIRIQCDTAYLSRASIMILYECDNSGRPPTQYSRGFSFFIRQTPILRSFKRLCSKNKFHIKQVNQYM